MYGSITSDKLKDFHSVKNSTKIALTSAFVGILLFGGQMPNAFAQQPQSQSSANTSVLRIGSRGQAVKEAQIVLKQEGFYKGPINGIFSSQMQSAVKAFQRSESITADGIIGAETQAAFK